MELNQGNPLSAVIKVKAPNQQGQMVYVSDLSGYTMEALLRDNTGRVYAKWSTEEGTITAGTIVVEGTTIGILALFLDGSRTAEIPFGDYTLELAKVFDNEGNDITEALNRAIGQFYRVIKVRFAAIRNGV